VQVTLKPEASPEDFEQAKKDVESKGGKITHEFKLIKGFTYVSPFSALSPGPTTHQPHHPKFGSLDTNTTPSAELPDDLVSTFESNDKITVEKDSEVTTQ
jgi:hypothetical protein